MGAPLRHPTPPASTSVGVAIHSVRLSRGEGCGGAAAIHGRSTLLDDVELYSQRRGVEQLGSSLGS
ncbi:hypothetical protein F750_3828 [Streptomyces sp. PAMC 26508]|nr:hypothetical protein F750_3828 [Streptomyces sp. PAMC 26508]